MGFESFRVEMTGGSATVAAVEEVLRTTLGAIRDTDSELVQGDYYLVRIAGHVFEIELSAPPLRLSCRFTLCHPSSVDDAFLSLIRIISTRFPMDLRNIEETDPDAAFLFSPSQFEEFERAVKPVIARRRQEWIAMFGPETTPAKTNEALERFVFPHCEPVAVS